jgi:putative Mg2+ transporter-C (MgtC) family protein
MVEQFADPNLIIFGKLLLAAVLGILIGTERAIVGKRAGTRTFALVALGACMFTVISTNVTSQYLGIVNFDPMRTTAGIITGIGFIGAGMIVFRQQYLRGLTTASGLWVAASVGIAVGFGMYSVAVFTTVLTLVIFTLLWFFEYKMKELFSAKAPATSKENDKKEEDTDE